LSEIVFCIVSEFTFGTGQIKACLYLVRLKCVFTRFRLRNASTWYHGQLMHVLHITIFTKEKWTFLLFEPLTFLVGMAFLNRCPISPTSWPLVRTTSFQEKVHWRRSASSVACMQTVGGICCLVYQFVPFRWVRFVKHLPYAGSI
jgi:hypothetical protein